MITKEDIQDLLQEIDMEEVLSIRYNGFNGHGINGVSGQSMRIREDVRQNVSYIEQYDGEINKTVIISYEFRERYLIARYIHYKKTKYNKEFNRGREYGVVVPYDSITSIDIVKV